MNDTAYDLAIVGGRVLGEDGAWQTDPVFVSNGIVATSAETRPGVTLNAEGLLVLPGIVDLHGDAFERQIMPRPGVHFSHASALLETDNQMIANGITTAYHGLTYSWEPGLRGAAAARAFVAALDAVRPRLTVDTRLHLRHETFNLTAETEILHWIAEGRVDLLAFNDHMLHIEQQVSRPEKLAIYAGRTGMAPEAFLALQQEVKSAAPKVPESIRRLAEAARAKGVPMASHDDERPEDRAEFEKIGCTICEFPVDEATAGYAISRGDPVVMGAPNVMRGGSHCGRLGAAAAIGAGLGTILTSDYYYPSLPMAAFKLAQDGVVTLAAAWEQVSKNPARAAGLYDRGVIAPGKRADIILVDGSDEAAPSVAAAIVQGRLAYFKNDARRLVA